MATQSWPGRFWRFGLVYRQALVLLLCRSLCRSGGSESRASRIARSITPAKGDGGMLPRPAFCAIALICSLFGPLSPAWAVVRAPQAPALPPTTQGSFYCPMHPDIRSDKQGKCPRCGMPLRAGTPASQPEPPATGQTDAEIKDASPEIPDVTIYDQNGKRLSFYSELVKGKTVAINFIFTTCTTICPALTAIMGRVQQQL